MSPTCLPILFTVLDIPKRPQLTICRSHISSALRENRRHIVQHSHFHSVALPGLHGRLNHQCRMAIASAPSKVWPHLVYASDPYTNLLMVGNGIYGYIFQLDKDRVVKVAKTYAPDLDARDFSLHDKEYLNEINRKTIDNEIKVYERLGRYKGIISCLQTTNYGIELAFADEGNLQDYIGTKPEPLQSLKTGWILSVIDTLSYVHSKRVLVDEIALRNFLVADGQLKLSDFGQSALLPLSTDMDTVCDNDLTTKIEILHLGWVIYSISKWGVHLYYFFDKQHQMEWPKEFPPLEKVFCRSIIDRCWRGEYANMKDLQSEAHEALD